MELQPGGTKCAAGRWCAAVHLKHPLLSRLVLLHCFKEKSFSNHCQNLMALIWPGSAPVERRDSSCWSFVWIQPVREPPASPPASRLPALPTTEREHLHAHIRHRTPQIGVRGNRKLMCTYWNIGNHWISYIRENYFIYGLFKLNIWNIIVKNSFEALF